VLGALTQLLSNETLCDAFGLAGAARFESAFTDRHFAARFARLLPITLREIIHALAP
jgi:hypothetical protein